MDTRTTGLKFPELLIYKGYSAPVRIEADIWDLEIEGAIPLGIKGTYYRNCADPRFPPLHGKDIFLNGDGMLHMLSIEDGYADLKTRYVRTEKFELERRARRSLFGAYRNPFTDAPEALGKSNNTANTSVMWHHGKLYALKESARPVQIDPDTLLTLGSQDFGGVLTSQTFTAHPKLDPQTGEAIAFSYNAPGHSTNEIQIHTIAATGELIRSEVFNAPYCSMVHDFHVSENFIAFTICPMVNDWDRVKNGEPFFHWDSTKKTYVGVIPRKEGIKAIRWFTCPVVAMQTHTFNAWEEGSTLHLDHFVTGSGWLSQFPDLHNPEAKEKPPFAERWSFDLSQTADQFNIARLFNHIGEMPMVDPRYLMRRVNNFWFGTNNPALGPML